tara:strand:- start:11 stop:472 length:462 start_codon:yes stop_codon:yes gene_type:complete
MNKEINKITEDVVTVINALEEVTAKAIKDNNANPNKAGFTSIQDAMGIGIMYSLNSSIEFHLQRANEMQLKAQANYKNSGSATWFGENEHRERVIVECLQEIMEELETLFSKPSVNIAKSWADLKGESKAVEIPLSDINAMREKQGLQPLNKI